MSAIRQGYPDGCLRAHQAGEKELYKSLTWDRGKEFTDHRRFTLATKIDVYFCDPQSPWQRGSNENTNGLLRQYFSNGTDLSAHSQANLNKWLASSTNDHVRPCNLKPQQRDLTPVLRRPVAVSSTSSLAPLKPRRRSRSGHQRAR